MEENDYLRLNLKALSAVGLWPINANTIVYKIHKIYCVFVMCYFGLFVTSEYIEIGLRLSENFFDIVNNLSVSLLYTVTVVKMKITKSQEAQKFVNGIFKFENAIMKSDDEELKQIFKTHINWNRNLSKLFISLTAITTVPFYVNPIMTELTNPVGNLTETIDDAIIYKTRALPFSSWFPFNKYKYYSITYVFQMVAGCFGSALTCCTDIFFWACMIFGISQIKILQHKLKNLKGYGKKYALENSLVLNEGITCVLRECVILHQDLIQYIFELNKSINFLMFMDFGICSMQIGVIGFQVVVSGFGWSQVFAMEYLLAMLTQMFLFYWHANEILLQSPAKKAGAKAKADDKKSTAAGSKAKKATTTAASEKKAAAAAKSKAKAASPSKAKKATKSGPTKKPKAPKPKRAKAAPKTVAKKASPKKK